MLIVTERLDELPWDHGFGSLTLARALVNATDAPVRVACDVTDRPIDAYADIAPGVEVITMRGERPRHDRRPRAFQSWLSKEFDERATLSLTPLAPGDVWMPGWFPSLATVRDELQRSTAYITLLKSRRWILPRIAATAGVPKRVESNGRVLAALDDRNAAHLAARLGVDDSRVQVAGRFSGLARDDEGWMTSGRRLRAALGIDEAAFVALLFCSQPRGPAARLLVDAIAQARRSGIDAHLLVMGFRQNGLIRLAAAANISDAVHPVGSTARIRTLHGAADAVALPPWPSSPRDAAVAADALRLGRILISGPDGPGAPLADIRADGDDASSWANALSAAAAATPHEAAAEDVSVQRLATWVRDQLTRNGFGW